jgi:hypothetical protein
MLPMQPGLPERRTHDYKRNGTTTLFAALEIATGKVTGVTDAGGRHRGREEAHAVRTRRQRRPHAVAAPPTLPQR